VFGGGPMGVRGKFVQFRGSPVDLVHGGISSGGTQPFLRVGTARAIPLAPPRTATTTGGAAIGSTARAGISRRRPES
jgi:hypothetical protein